MSTNNTGDGSQSNINKMGKNAYEGAQSLSNKLGDVREGVNAQVKDFSSKASNFSSKEFLESNSIIAKFVFLILVLIGFLIIMYLGILLITYFMGSSNSPYVITGINNGNNYKIIPQDPRNTQAITIYRSNNAKTGAEFTWSVWLKIDGSSTNDSIFNHVFSKGGNGTFNPSGIMKTNNAPGVYLKTSMLDTNNAAPKTAQNTQTNITVFMNVASTTPTDDIKTITESATVTGVPIGAWFNFMVRLENKVMDLYINGTLTQRNIFTNIPIQNYDDVFVCGNGGFNGSLSDLRYFNRSLNVFEINNIVAAGPNLTVKGGVNDTPSQLSYMWYNSNANV